jgi:hypothetical protein
VADDAAPVDPAVVARANALIGYHSPIAHRLTTERTSYQSQMIPVTSYILIACCEAFLRYPDLMRTIAAAMDPEEIGSDSSSDEPPLTWRELLVLSLIGLSQVCNQ